MKTKFANLILCLTLVAVAIGTCVIVAAPAAAQSTPTPTYTVVRTMLLGGDGGWDYVYADSGTRRLYIARATRFMVADLDSGKLVGEIPDTPGAHGVALVPDLGIGFTTNGRENTSSVFDLKTLKVSEKIKTGEGPDAIVYDSASGNIFTMNGHGKSASVIDPKSRKVIATIPLSGKPETPVPDGKGRMYINIEDKNSLAVVDTKTNKVIAEWPMAGCEEPSGLDMDRDGGDLFAACGNKLMAIVDSKTGKLIATIPTGDGSDGLAYDPKAKLAVASNGEGNMSFVGKRDGKYVLIENVPTKKGARTITFDAATGQMLSVSADMGPAPKPSPDNPRGRPSPLPNSFVVIAVGKK
jgi:YVTN family beta-propeller protein